MKWISVKDRLPDVGIYVLGLLAGYYGSSILAVSRQYTAETEWRAAQTREVVPVTHWMPLPEPPEKKKRWGYTKGRNSDRYFIYDGEVSVRAEAICDALNGPARELLEFAGITEECDCRDPGAFVYQSHVHDGYLIKNWHTGEPYAPQDLVKMLDSKRCDCGHHK